MIVAGLSFSIKPNAAAAAAAKPAQQKFPPSFQAWVERCFSKCKTNADRQASAGSEVWGGLEKGQNRQGVRKVEGHRSQINLVH